MVVQPGAHRGNTFVYGSLVIGHRYPSVKIFVVENRRGSRLRDRPPPRGSCESGEDP
jgi:hypothetical protein